MSTDELEKLIRRLLAQGITVIILSLGPAGGLSGTGPEAEPTDSGSSQVEAPSTGQRPSLVAPDDGADGGTAGEPGGGLDTGPGEGGGDRSDGTADDGTAEGGTADDRTAHDRTAEDGTAEDGTAEDGTADGGTPDGGTAGDGTVEDGTAEGGTVDGGTADGGRTGAPAGSKDGQAAVGVPDDGGAAGGEGGGGGGGGEETGGETGGNGTGDRGSAGDTTGTAPSGHDTTPDGTVSGAGATAAERFGWGRPVATDDFTDGTSGWSIYDGPGHAGNGRRTPEAVSVSDGVLTITGDAEGNTAGMAWTQASQKYGRWEGRVRAPASDPSYNALLLLWPTAENFPEGGEVDFMEMMEPSRQTTNMFLHYGADNSQIEGEVEVDGTRWHNWAVEWTPQRIAAFVDGEQWFETTDTSILPPGPMHLCIQLDWFPKGGQVQESQMHVDWVRQYAIDGAAS